MNTDFGPKFLIFADAIAHNIGVYLSSWWLRMDCKPMWFTVSLPIFHFEFSAQQLLHSFFFSYAQQENWNFVIHIFLLATLMPITEELPQ